MKTCPGCQAEVAAEATTCPHCGAEMAAEAKDGPYPGFWFVFVGAVVASLLVVVGLLLGLVLLGALAGALALLLMQAARVGGTRLFIQVLRSEWKTYALVLACIAILLIVAAKMLQPQISHTLNNTWWCADGSPWASQNPNDCPTPGAYSVGCCISAVTPTP